MNKGIKIFKIIGLGPLIKMLEPLYYICQWSGQVNIRRIFPAWFILFNVKKSYHSSRQGKFCGYLLALTIDIYNIGALEFLLMALGQ